MVTMVALGGTFFSRFILIFHASRLFHRLYIAILFTHWAGYDYIWGEGRLPGFSPKHIPYSPVKEDMSLALEMWGEGV